MRRKLTLNRDTVRVLTHLQIVAVLGGASGPPCDDTLAASKCDFGCATGANPCFESAQTQGICRA